jgi:hypothetical protein
MPKLLILGCGRSGTRYVTKVLACAGLQIGHEKPGRDGMCNWRSVGQPDDIESHDVVWHQVRHPLGVIASFHTVMGRSWDYICEVEPRISRDDSLLLRCMKYWLYWNERCAQAATVTYRVENIAALLPSLLERMQVSHSETIISSCLSISTKDHTRQKVHKVSSSYPTVTWDDVFAADESIALQIRQQGEKFGYNFSEYS